MMQVDVDVGIDEDDHREEKRRTTDQIETCVQRYENKSHPLLLIQLQSCTLAHPATPALAPLSPTVDSRQPGPSPVQHTHMEAHDYGFLF